MWAAFLEFLFLMYGRKLKFQAQTCEKLMFLYKKSFEMRKAIGL